MSQARGKREIPDPIASHRQFREAPLKGRSLTDFATDVPPAPALEDVPAAPPEKQETPQAARKAPAQRRSRSDSEKAGWQPQTLILPPELRRWLRVYAAQRDIDMSDIAAQALEEYRQRHRDE